MNVVLWIAAGLLATVALMGGMVKMFIPKKKLAKQPGAGWVKDVSSGFVKFLGILEILAAIGLIFPAILNLRQWSFTVNCCLTPCSYFWSG